MSPAKRPISTSKGSTRESDAKMYTGALIGMFAFAIFLMLSVTVVTSTREASARQSMSKTFTQVHNKQGVYRAESGRFATWDELAAAGAKLEPFQTVAASNADASHWFLSLRDEKTGVICDRLGVLNEATRTRSSPDCRTAP